MMKRLLLLVLCVACGIRLAGAQTDSLAQRIEARTSISTRIQNGRQVLLDEVRAGNTQMIGRVRGYLDSLVRDTPYIALTEREYLLSLYLTRDFDTVLTRTAAVDSLASPDVGVQYINPNFDELALGLPGLTQKSREAINGALDAKGFGVEQRRYLDLVLERLLINNIDELRETAAKARAHLADYPSSPQRAFLVNNMYLDIRESDFGWGLNLGLGMMILDSKDDFRSPGGSLSLGFDIQYRRLWAGIGMYMGMNGLKRDLTYKEMDFARGDRLDITGLDLQAGVRVFDTKRFRGVAYGTVGGSGATVKIKGTQNLSDDNSRSKSSFTYGGGAFVDLKFPMKSLDMLTGPTASYAAIRLRYHLTSANYAFRGTKDRSITQWITLEFAGVSHKTRRN